MDDEEIGVGGCVCVCLCMHAVAVHVIMDIFIPTLCSTAADIARDVAGFAYGREGGGRLTHTYAREYQDIEDDGSSRTKEKRTKLNIVLFFFYFILLFILFLRAR